MENVRLQISNSTAQTDRTAKRITVFAGLYLLLAIVLVIATQWNLGKTRRELVRTLKSIDTVHLLQVRLLTVERYAQAHVLTKSDGSLQAFQENRKGVQELLDILGDWLRDNPVPGLTTDGIHPLIDQELELLQSIVTHDEPESLLVEHEATHDALEQELGKLLSQLDERLIAVGLERSEKLNAWIFGIVVLLGMGGWLAAMLFGWRKGRTEANKAE